MAAAVGHRADSAGLARLLTWTERPVVRLICGAVTLVLIAAALCRYLQFWPQVSDLLLWDETDHLGRGLYSWSGPPRSYEVQALYSLFYRALWHQFSDPVRLQFIAGLVGVISCTAAVTVATWALSENALIGATCASLLVGSGSLLVTPRALFLAIAVCAIGAAVATRTRTFLAGSALMALTCFVATFLRPEFVLSLYLLCTTTVVAAAQRIVADRRHQDEHARNAWLTVAGCGSALLLLLTVLDVPIVSGGDRAFVAFGQSFAWRWSLVNAPGTDVGLIWQQVVQRALPGAHSQLAALSMYPAAVIGFLWQNVRDTPGALWALLGGSLTVSPVFSIALAASVAGWLLAVALLKRQRAESTPDRRLWGRDVLLIGPILLGPLLSIVLVFPRQHYLLLFTTGAMLLIARSLRKIPRPLAGVLSVAVAATLCVTVRPAPPSPQPVVSTIDALRAHGGIRRMLEAGHGYCAYLPQPCKRYSVFDLPEGRPILDTIDLEGVDAVVITPELRALTAARQDSPFLGLISEAAPVGWTRSIVGPDVVLLTRPARTVDPRYSWALELHDKGSVARLERAVERPQWMRVAIEQATNRTPFNIQLQQVGLALRSGEPYQLTLRARAVAPRSMLVGVSIAHPPWRGLGFYEPVALTSEWVTVERRVTLTQGDTNSRIHFDLGADPSTVEIEDVQLRRLPAGDLVTPPSDLR